MPELTTELEHLLAWCHLNEARVHWVNCETVLVDVRRAGWMYLGGGSSFVAAVHDCQKKLQGMDYDEDYDGEAGD